MKALLVFGMSAITATSIVGFAACDSGSGSGSGNGNGGGEGTHQHTWSAWSDNGNGTHSRECTAEGHEGEKTETEDHKDANSDNVCDDCGVSLGTVEPGPDPIVDATTKDYATLAAQENVLIKNDFSEALTVDLFNTHGLKGIYTNKAGAVSVTGGELVQAAGQGANFETIIDIGPVVGGTVIEGSVKTTLVSKLGSGWKFFNLYDNGTSVLNVTANKANTAFAYTIKGVTTPAPAKEVTSQLDTPYTIYFKLDLSNGKLTLGINGDIIFNEVVTEIRNVSAIRLLTSDSGNRQQKIDDLVVCGTAQTLEQFKETKKAQLDKVYTDLDKATNYTQNGEDLDTALATAKAGVDAAEDYPGIITAYNNGVESIKAVKSDLVLAKDAAINELTTSYAENNYEVENWVLVQEEITKGTNAINVATDAAGVTAALNSAKEEISKIPDKNAVTLDVTIHVGATTAVIKVVSGKTTDADTVAEAISGNITEGQIIGGYYQEEGFANEFNFNTAITAATDIYVKLVADERTEHENTFAWSNITGITTDKATVSNDTLQTGCTGDAGFLTVVDSTQVTYRTSNSCIENKDANLKVTFKGTGTITISFASTGKTNISRIGLRDSEGSYLEATSTTATETTGVADVGTYQVTSTGYKTVTFTVTKAGEYFIVCPSGDTGRGARINTIDMVDKY